MKHKLLLLLLLLTGSMAWAEHGFLSTIPIIHPLYGQLYQYEPKGVYPLPDGSMYVLGTAGWYDDINGIPWSYGAVVTLLDPNGNLVWHRYPLPFSGSCQIVFIDLDSQNSIHYIINYYGEYLIGETSFSGVSSVGTAQTIINQSLYLYSAKRLPTNEVLMAGESLGKALLARLTASGDTISVARYARDPDSGITDTAIYDLEFDNDGNVLNLCKLSSLIHATILKTDIDGNIISRHDWIDSNFTSAGPQKYIGDGSNGGYEILISATSITSQTGPQICVYNNGEISFLDNLYYMSDVIIRSLMRIANHRYFLAKNSTNTCVYKISSAGEILWTWVDNRFWNVTTYMNDNVALYGDKVIATGASNSRFNLYAVELLPNGQVELDDDTQSPAVNVLSVYPNPMKDKLTIDTQSVAGAKTMIYIYNIRGQRIRSMILNGEIVEWDGKDSRGADCPNGVYAIRLASNNTVYYITIIK